MFPKRKVFKRLPTSILQAYVMLVLGRLNLISPKWLTVTLIRLQNVDPMFTSYNGDFPAPNGCDTPRYLVWVSVAVALASSLANCGKLEGLRSHLFGGFWG